MKEALFSAIGEVDDVLLAESEAKHIKRNWKPFAAIAACLALAVTVTIPLVGRDSSDQATFFVYNNKLNIQLEAKPSTEVFVSDSLAYHYSPKELVDRSEIIFRGTLLSLDNVLVDYNGTREHRARVTLRVDSVLKGDAKQSETVTLLMPFGFRFAKGYTTSATGTIEQMQEGMEGIFLMNAYDETSYSEYNGARLYLLDVADGTLSDGERYCFLSGKNGIFMHDVWKSKAGLSEDMSLDEIETHLKALILE